MLVVSWSTAIWVVIVSGADYGWPAEKGRTFRMMQRSVTMLKRIGVFPPRHTEIGPASTLVKAGS